MRKIAWITIDDGDTFEGTVEQFQDTYFDNADEDSIVDFCEKNGWKVEIRFADGSSI